MSTPATPLSRDGCHHPAVRGYPANFLGGSPYAATACHPANSLGAGSQIISSGMQALSSAARVCALLRSGGPQLTPLIAVSIRSATASGLET